MGKLRRGDGAEAIFNAFLAFMSSVAISTILLYGPSPRTVVAFFAGAIGLTGLIWNVWPHGLKPQQRGTMAGR